MEYYTLKLKGPKNLIKWYKARIYLSKDLRMKLATNSYNNMFIVYHALFTYGIFGCIFNFFESSTIIDNVKLQYYYYSMYIFVGVFGVILASIIRRIKRKSPFLITLPYTISFFYVILMDVYVFNVLKNPFTGLIIFSALGMITILCLHIDPLYMLVMVIILNCFVDSFVLESLGRHGLFGIILLSFLMFAMAMYKRKITKHDILRTSMLEENREILQDAVAEQIQEIRAQNNELQIQHQKIVDIQNNTIIGLSNLVENRDSDTGEHVRRTSAYVTLLAQKALGNGFYVDTLNEHYINLLAKAAPMHDIGKIVVPDSVLKKPGKLTEEEFEEIKRHTTEGGRIVREILGEGENQEYIDMAIDVATGHHERWDGKGYPKGLKADAIPLSARIMAIADVFDALVSPRCYKEPFTVEKAMSIIREESGSHFDPILAELFISMEDDAVAVMEKYKD